MSRTSHRRTIASSPSRTSRLRAGLFAAIVLLAIPGCSSSATTVLADDTSSIPPLADATPTPLPSGVPTPAPVEFASPLPAERPADFMAGYSETGGMAPWGEWVDIGPSTATYEVWMNGVTYTFDYTPTERQLDFVYDEVRLGHFHEYQVIPFADGEEVYDAGTSGYSASTAGYSHQLFHSEEDLDTPSTSHAPLSALAHFVDVADVYEAGDRLSIVLDDDVQSAVNADLEITFDLTGSTFGMGEERWADTFEIGWSGGPRDVVVTIATAGRGQGDELSLQSEQVVTFEPDGLIRISVDNDGTIVAATT